MYSNNPIDHKVSEMLSTFDPDEYRVFLSDLRGGANEIFYKAYNYIEDLPFSELPKWIGHPSSNIREIIQRRLAGRADFRYMDIHETFKTT